MRFGYFISLTTVVIFTAGYFYFLTLGICPTPLPYRVGEIDERFDITEAKAKAVAISAEEVWEKTLGRDLFVYDEAADFTINFIFDDRQALTDAESSFKDRLDTVENVNQGIIGKYNSLVSEYEELKTAYEADVVAYEGKLDSYNQKVQQYNENGGAPPKEYEQLQQEKRDLDKEQRSLNSMVKRLESLAAEINDLSNQGNQLIDTYNKGVDTYNKAFGEPREFTQGDYQGKFINIYTFVNEAELQLVLAHELGHALSLGHVAGPESIMYYLIGKQPTPLEPSEADIAEFVAVCEAPWWVTWKNLLF